MAGIINAAAQRAISFAQKQVDNLEAMERTWSAKAGRSRCGACARRRDSIRKQLTAAKSKLESVKKNSSV